MSTSTVSRHTYKRQDLEGELLTIADCARWLGVTRYLVYQGIESGQLPVVTLGQHRRIPRRAVERILEGQEG